MQIRLCDNYPSEAPEVICQTVPFHPNIDPEMWEQNVCLNVLTEWDRQFGLKSLLHALLFLFYEPNFDDPLNSATSRIPHGQTSSSCVQLSLAGGTLNGVTYTPNSTWCQWVVDNGGVAPKESRTATPELKAEVIEEPSSGTSRLQDQVELQETRDTQDLFQHFLPAQFSHDPRAMEMTPPASISSGWTSNVISLSDLLPYASLYHITVECLNNAEVISDDDAPWRRFKRYYFAERSTRLETLTFEECVSTGTSAALDYSNDPQPATQRSLVQLWRPRIPLPELIHMFHEPEEVDSDSESQTESNHESSEPTPTDGSDEPTGSEFSDKSDNDAENDESIVPTIQALDAFEKSCATPTDNLFGSVEREGSHDSDIGNETSIVPTIQSQDARDSNSFSTEAVIKTNCVNTIDDSLDPIESECSNESNAHDESETSIVPTIQPQDARDSNSLSTEAVIKTNCVNPIDDSLDPIESECSNECNAHDESDTPLVSTIQPTDTRDANLSLSEEIKVDSASEVTDEQQSSPSYDSSLIFYEPNLPNEYNASQGEDEVFDTLPNSTQAFNRFITKCRQASVLCQRLQPLWWPFYQTRWPPFFAPGCTIEVGSDDRRRRRHQLTPASTLQLKTDLFRYTDRIVRRGGTPSILLVDPLIFHPLHGQGFPSQTLLLKFCDDMRSPLYVLRSVEVWKHCYYVDLFVRASNKLALEIYTKLGYSVYRRVLNYYWGAVEDEDALDMRKALSADVERKSIIPMTRAFRPEELEHP